MTEIQRLILLRDSLHEERYSRTVQGGVNAIIGGGQRQGAFRHVARDDDEVGDNGFWSMGFYRVATMMLSMFNGNHWGD